MKANLLTIALSAAYAAGAQAAPETLSIAALDRAVAGSESNAAGETDAHAPTAVVADRARLELKLQRHIELRDDVHSGAQALNVVNSAHADVANAMNALHSTNALHAPHAAHTNTALSAIQHNDIAQTSSAIARAENIERIGANRSSAMHERASVSSARRSESFNEYVLRSASRHAIVDTYNAQVPGYFPLQNLQLTVGTPKLPAVHVPAFSIGVGYQGISVSASVGPFYFDPPQIVLGTVAVAGDDVVMRGGFVDLGFLDLGSATLRGCLGEACVSVGVDLPTIDGPRIDFGGELRLAGANPFKDVRINAGGGLSVAGRGRIRVDPGHVSLSASLSLDLPDLTTSFDFEVLGQKVSSGSFGVTIPAVEASITLIDADVGVAYDAEFNGALCLSIVTTSCEGLAHRETHQEFRSEVARTQSSVTHSSNESIAASGTETLSIGARMSGAEANLIAMSEGSAAIDTESHVQLNAGAQRGMKAFNAVNATGAMIGNALNVGALRSPAGAALSQSNVFTQFQTRPRR